MVWDLKTLLTGDQADALMRVRIRSLPVPVASDSRLWTEGGIRAGYVRCISLDGALTYAVSVRTVVLKKAMSVIERSKT